MSDNGEDIRFYKFTDENFLVEYVNFLLYKNNRLDTNKFYNEIKEKLEDNDIEEWNKYLGFHNEMFCYDVGLKRDFDREDKLKILLYGNPDKKFLDKIYMQSRQSGKSARFAEMYKLSLNNNISIINHKSVIGVKNKPSLVILDEYKKSN